MPIFSVLNQSPIDLFFNRIALARCVHGCDCHSCTIILDIPYLFPAIYVVQYPVSQETSGCVRFTFNEIFPPRRIVFWVDLTASCTARHQDESHQFI